MKCLTIKMEHFDNVNELKMFPDFHFTGIDTFFLETLLGFGLYCSVFKVGFPTLEIQAPENF